MESKRNADNNESTNLELVLEHIASEQKSQSKSLSGLILAINSISERVTNFEGELQNSGPISVSTDVTAIQEMIKKAVTEIKMVVASQEQKPIIKKYQVLLFPERDAKLFYKIVFGRWLLFLSIMLLLTNLYKFSVHFSDNQKDIKLQILDNSRIYNSWNNLYLISGKRFRKVMDSVYNKTE